MWRRKNTIQFRDAIQSPKVTRVSEKKISITRMLKAMVEERGGGGTVGGMNLRRQPLQSSRQCPTSKPLQIAFLNRILFKQPVLYSSLPDGNALGFAPAFFSISADRRLTSAIATSSAVKPCISVESSGMPGNRSAFLKKSCFLNRTQ